MKGIRGNFTSMNVFKDITYYYRELGKCLFEGYVDAALLTSWNQPFLGRYINFHDYIGGNNNKVTRKTANLPKMIGEYIIKNMYAEYPKLVIENTQATEQLVEILKNNDFQLRDKQATETMIHLGGKFTSFYIEDSKIKLKYIDGNRGFVTSFKNNQPHEAVFITRTKRIEKRVLGKEQTIYYVLLEWHYEENGIRYVENELYKSGNQNNNFSICSSDEVQRLYGTVIDMSVQEYRIDCPTFVYTSTPIKNNKDLNSQEGIGAFINALDPLMSTDEVYDAMSVEVVEGMIQKIIGESALEQVRDSNGKEISVYNPKNPHILVYNDEKDREATVTVSAPTLRLDQQIMSFNTNLDLVSIIVGISAGTLRFDGKSITTATQVLTEKSDTARTIKNYEQQVGEGIKRLLLLIKEVSNVEAALDNIPEFEMKDIDVQWQDNVIVDDEEKLKTMKEDAQDYVIPTYMYIMEQYNVDKKEAQEIHAEALAEREANMPTFEDIDDSDPDGENDEEIEPVEEVVDNIDE